MQVDMELERSLSGNEVERKVTQRRNYDAATLPGMHKVYLQCLKLSFFLPDRGSMMQVDMELERSLSGNEVEREVIQRCNYDAATFPGMYKVYFAMSESGFHQMEEG